MGGARRHGRSGVTGARYAGRRVSPRRLPELVNEGRTGLLADADDEDQLARELRQAAGLDAAECRRAAAQRFTPAAMAERYLGLYDLVLTRAGRNVPREPGTPARGEPPAR